MRINAINGYSNLYFQGRGNRVKNEHTASSNLYMSVPLAVAIAMSPNAVYSAQYSTNPVQNSQKTEQVVDNSPVRVVGEKEILTQDKDEFCRFIAYNTNDNAKDAELVGFNYNGYTKDGNIGVLNGVFQAICPEKTPDDKYIVTYEKIQDGSNSGEIKFCKVPVEFGNYLIGFGISKYNNNAIDIVSIADLKSTFGEDEVQNASDIINHISYIEYPAKY